ncbi:MULTISPECIES: hypothetical protein [Chryseobacterium]|nr:MULTISPECIES: hypothetical protein [Chryseobacterium]
MGSDFFGGSQYASGLYSGNNYSMSFMYGGGGSNGDPGPSRWQGFKDWIRNLFGGKRGAEITAFAPGATVSRAVQVGEVIPMGEAILTWEEVVAAVGSIAKGGLWAMPLMLNGDSSHARGYDIPLTGATDVPADESGILLYRGIASPKNVFDADMYSQGLMGIAIPNGLRIVSTLKGPHRSQDLHAEGDNYSIWTSWTTDPAVAKHFSGGSGGIILSKYFQAGQAIPNLSITAQGNSIPSGKPENEWLVPGVVYGANVQLIK